MGEDGIKIFFHEFFIGGIHCHNDSSILMFVFYEFSSLVSDFEDEGFVLVLGQFILIFEDALDDFTVEGLVFADALLDVHDYFSVGLLERFLFVESGVGSFV
jgi:hypothetical protein